MITADKREYRKGYNMHLSTYKTIDDTHRNSSRLLLFYSVECGLKYLLMDKWGIASLKEIGEDHEKLNMLSTHNLNIMLKALGQQGMVKFLPFKTCHNDSVDAVTYHQVYRYSVGVQSKDIQKEQAFEKDLETVSDWIYERM